MPDSEKFVRGHRKVMRADERGLVRAAVNAGGKPGDVPKFVPAGTPMPEHNPRDEHGQLRYAALCGPDGEDINTMSYGEQVVEALDEYVDAKIRYDFSRRVSGEDYANPKPVSKAREALTKLLDRKVRVRA